VEWNGSDRCSCIRGSGVAAVACAHQALPPKKLRVQVRVRVFGLKKVILLHVVHVSGDATRGMNEIGPDELQLEGVVACVCVRDSVRSLTGSRPGGSLIPTDKRPRVEVGRGEGNSEQ